MDKGRTVRAIGLLFATAGFSALAGSIYAELLGTGHPAVSAVNGIFIGTPFLAYERGYLLPRLRSRLRRSATPRYATASLALFVLVFAIGSIAARLLLRGLGMDRLPLARTMALAPAGLAYSIGVSLLLVAVLRMRDLIGPGIFASLLIGRYYRPVQENRVFLFLDLVGSTRFADQHGAFQMQELLGEVFGVLAGPVRRFRGSIDDYVGDMAIVTWTLERGTRNGAAVRCLFAFLDEIDRDADKWRRRFGGVPRFRAALHCGPVVTAEIGLERHKITYFGDVVNTTSRLESLSKSLGEPFILSVDLLDRLQSLAPGIVATRLGQHALRGRDERLDVASLRRSGEGSKALA